MKNIYFAGILFLLLLPFSYPVYGQSGKVPSGLQTYTCTIDGFERTYHLYLPEQLPENAPLVFVLHGYGGDVNLDYGMDKVAEKNKFAVCYPKGIKDGRGNPCWNVGYPFQADMTVDDVSFLCQLAELLQKKFQLSPQNTFCTGLSNGGEMCYLLAYRKPDVFSAVAPIAGLTMEWIYREYDCPQAIPLLEIHGTEDRTSEWDGDLEDKGGWGAYIPVPLAINYWVAKNRCTQEQVDTLAVKDSRNGHYVVSHKYLNGTGGNEVWLYEIVNGQHGWGEQDVNTAEEIWKFFGKFVKKE